VTIRILNFWTKKYQIRK